VNGPVAPDWRQWSPRLKRIAVAQPSRRTRRVVGVLIGAFWAAFLMARLFFRGTVGLADETDGHRYLCQRGLQAVLPSDNVRLYWHIYTTYNTHTWYGETCGTYRGDETKYASSHEAVLWLGQQLNGLFGMPGAFDLRTLAIVYALVIGVAIGLTFALLPGNLLVRLVITVGIGLVYTESVVAVYFVSPYAEPTVWCGFALLLPALLWFWKAPEISWPRLALVVGISFFTIAAKTQAVGYLPAILFALLWKRSPLSDSRHTAQALRRRATGLMAAARGRGRSIVAGALLVTAVGGYVGTGGNLTVYSQLNVYEMVFTTLLPAGHDPAADLRWMGADPALAYASGTSVVSGDGASYDPRLLTFSRDVSQVTVLRFVAAHPLRLVPLTQYGLRALGHWRPAYLGNYTDTPAHPGLQQECRDCFYYYLFTPARKAPFWFGVLLLLTLLGGLWIRNVGFIPAPNRVMGKVAVFFVLATFGEFWTVQLTQGVGDEVKHHVFTLLPMMLCVPSFIGCLLLGRRVPDGASDDTSDSAATGTGDGDEDNLATAPIPAAAGL